MNITPDSIDKYKQQMLNMYRSSPTRVNSSTTSNMATARSLAANVPQPSASENTASSIPANTASRAPANTANVSQPFPVPNEAIPSLIEDAIALNAQTEANELNLFDPSLEAEEREFVPTYNAAYIIDTGNIAAPNFPGIPDTQPASPLPITPNPPAGVQVPDTGYIAAPNFPGIPDTQPASPPADVQVPDTGYIEVPKFPGIPDTQPAVPLPEYTMGVGYLRTQAFTGNRAIPVVGALIIITEHVGDKVNLVRIMLTDESGYTETVPLPVPEYDRELYPDPKDCPFRDYRISAFAEGYYIIKDVPVPIYAGVKSLQPIVLVPLRENEEKANYIAKPIDEILAEVGVDNPPPDVTMPDSPGKSTPDVGNIAAPGSVG